MHILLRKNRLPVIRSRRLVIRDIRREDVSEAYVQWLNDPETVKFLEVRFAPQSRSQVEEYVQAKLSNLEASKHFGVYDHDGARLVGTVTLPSIRTRHLASDISFVIGHPEARGQGYGTEAVHAVTFYMFRVLGFCKLWAGYYDGHVGSAKVLANNGYQVEGRLKKELIDYRGIRVDHVLVGLTADDFQPRTEWLGELPPVIEQEGGE